MKNKFFGHYCADEQYENEVWDDAVLVVDTNVLLDIYRVSPETYDDLIKVLNTYATKERLWIPYQVAQEYHEELYHVVFSQMRNYDSAYKCLNDFKEKINQKRNHPFLTDAQHQEIERITNDIKCAFERQKEKLKQSVKGPSMKTEIANIFNGRVGEEPQKDDLQEIYEEGKRRYSEKIPPGYVDKCKEGNKQYGDLIVWKQIISYAKDNQHHIIFVSSDTKEDWYLKDGSQLIMPHPQLLQEFAKETGKHIVIYSLELFLKIVRDRNLTDVKDKTIDEVGKITKLDNNMSRQFSDRNEMTENSNNVTNTVVLKRIQSDSVCDSGNTISNS